MILPAFRPRRLAHAALPRHEESLSSEPFHPLQQALADAQQQIRVLSTFVALTQAASQTSDLETLARHAQEALQANLPGLQAAFYRRVGGRWVAQVTTAGLPEALQAVLQQGLSLETPSFVQAVDAGEPIFFDDWNAREQQIPLAEGFRSVALAPYFRGGQPHAMLTVAFGRAEAWTEQRRQLFISVHQALLSAQQREIQSDFEERELGLQAFVKLTEAIGVGTDHLEAAQRAHDLLLELLPGWSFGYYELQGDLWKALLADVPDPTLRQLLYDGLPADTPGFRAAVQAGGPVFFDHWNAAEQGFAHTEAYGVAAFTLPAPGAAVAMFVIGSQHERVWKSQDRGCSRPWAAAWNWRWSGPGPPPNWSTVTACCSAAIWNSRPPIRSWRPSRTAPHTTCGPRCGTSRALPN